MASALHSRGLCRFVGIHLRTQPHTLTMAKHAGKQATGWADTDRSQQACHSTELCSSSSPATKYAVILSGAPGEPQQAWQGSYRQKQQPSHKPLIAHANHQHTAPYVVQPAGAAAPGKPQQVPAGAAAQAASPFSDTAHKTAHNGTGPVTTSTHAYAGYCRSLVCCDCMHQGCGEPNT